jgi:hypothetical protein
MDHALRQMRRYHFKVYFPPHTLDMCAEFFSQLNELYVTYHAAYQMCDDSRSIIVMPTIDDLMRPESKLIEFYENLDESGMPLFTMQKALIRVHHLNEKFDFTYLIAREGYIVSAWCSAKADNHRLTRSLYDYYCPSWLKKDTYRRIRPSEESMIAA